MKWMNYMNRMQRVPDLIANRKSQLFHELRIKIDGFECGGTCTMVTLLSVKREGVM